MSSIFLSHSWHDKSFARRLAQDLRSYGIRVWIDEAEIRVGDSLVEKIRSGIDETEYVGAIISSRSVQSEWVRRELDIAMNKEIAGHQVKVLPILIEGNLDLPGFLLGKAFADFRPPHPYYDGLTALLRRLLPDQNITSPSSRSVNNIVPEEGPIHQPSIEGWFYPESPEELLHQIEQSFENSSVGPGSFPPSKAGDVYTVIGGNISTAALDFGGFSNAHFLRYLKADRNASTFVVIAPRYMTKSEGIYIYPPRKQKWSTPFGAISIDAEFVDHLVKLGFGELDDEAFQREFAVEAPISFLRYTFPIVRLVPILLLVRDYAEIRQLSECLAKTVSRLGWMKRVVFISTSVGKFPTYKDCLDYIGDFESLVRSMDSEGLWKFLVQVRPKIEHGVHPVATGAAALSTVMDVSRRLGASSGRVLRWYHSSEIIGDRGKGMLNYALSFERERH